MCAPDGNALRGPEIRSIRCHQEEIDLLRWWVPLEGEPFSDQFTSLLLSSEVKLFE